MKFFRIILHPISKKSQLELPVPLVSKYRESLTGIVTLGAPGGRKWKVWLKEEDGRVWLRRGWPEFATCLGLKPGYFCLFDYKQVECKFHVEVFDPSTLQIEYPIMATAGGGDDSAIGNNVPEAVLKRPKVEENDHISEHDNCGEEISGRMTQHENDEQLRYVVKGRVPHGVSASQIERALAKALAFKFDGPVIIVTMQPFYVSTRCYLPISASFIGRYLNQKNKAAILKLHDGSIWSVAYDISKKRVKFKHGWPQFVADNSLKVGDVCAFEVVKEAENTLRVFISRAAGETCDNEAKETTSQEQL